MVDILARFVDAGMYQTGKHTRLCWRIWLFGEDKNARNKTTRDGIVTAEETCFIQGRMKSL